VAVGTVGAVTVVLEVLAVVAVVWVVCCLAGLWWLSRLNRVAPRARTGAHAGQRVLAGPIRGATRAYNRREVPGELPCRREFPIPRSSNSAMQPRTNSRHQRA